MALNGSTTGRTTSVSRLAPAVSASPERPYIRRARNAGIGTQAVRAHCAHPDEGENPTVRGSKLGPPAAWELVHAAPVAGFTRASNGTTADGYAEKSSQSITCHAARATAAQWIKVVGATTGRYQRRHGVDDAALIPPVRQSAAAFGGGASLPTRGAAPAPCATPLGSELGAQSHHRVYKGGARHM